jgi:hypothetical protein
MSGHASGGKYMPVGVTRCLERTWNPRSIIGMYCFLVPRSLTFATGGSFTMGWVRAPRQYNKLGRVFGRREVDETFHNFCWQTDGEAVFLVSAQGGPRRSFNSDPH